MSLSRYFRWPILALATAALLARPISEVNAQEMGGSPTMSAGIGWSVLNIDDIEATAITDYFVTEVQDHQSNHDGELNGYRLNGEIAGLHPHRRGDWLVSFAVKGFYSRYKGSQQSRCVYTSDTDCVFFPLVDPDPNGTIGVLDDPDESGGSSGGADASGGFFSDWLTDVDREIVHWGAAAEINLNRQSAPSVSLKDAPAPVITSPFLWRAGLAFRRFDQDMSLHSEDRGPTLDPVTLDDNLSTNYYGGYFGFSSWHPLGDQFQLKLGGETGIYYADTDYSGDYTATASLGDGSPIASSVRLSDSAPAFIGLLNLALERDLGSATLALFGEAEWISYVPKVLYNDTDRNGGVPFDIDGSQDGTALGEGSAFTYTLGARVSIPMH